MKGARVKEEAIWLSDVYIVVLGLVAGFADFLGGYLTVIRRVSRQTVGYFIALGAGFLLGGAFLEILPEAVEATPAAPLFMATGYFVIFLIEHVFASEAHGHGLGHSHDRDGHGGFNMALMAEHSRTPHTLVGEPHGDEPMISGPASLAALAGLLVHTFFDGAAIAVGFKDSSRVGVLMFAAVMLHKLPEGFSLSSVMLAAAQGRARAILATVAIAATTVLGAVATIFLRDIIPASSGVFLAIATGTFIYIGASDLIPATAGGRGKTEVLLVLAGVFMVYGLSLLLRLAGLE